MTTTSLLRSAALTIALGGILLLTPAPSQAWGHRGHAVIDRAALEALPADGPLFLQRYTGFIEDSATLPDDWRDDAVPFSEMDEDPNHGWFKEQFAFLHPIPRSRFEFILALYDEQRRLQATDPGQAALMNVRWTGTLPYAVMEVYGHLVTGLTSYREALAKGEPTQSIETACAFYVAWLGHYVGDGAQPLHITIQHDGWHGDNPHGYTTDPHIHGRMESHFVDAIGLNDKDVLPLMHPLDPIDGDVFDTVLAYLDTSNTYVEEVYKIDQRGGWEQPTDTEARTLIDQRIAAGADMLRDLIVRAWRESALPPVRQQPRPVDPHNPRYNPQTGSAPAALSAGLSAKPGA